MATKGFVERIFAIFATNSSFLHEIENLHINQYNIQYVPYVLLAQEILFLTQQSTFFCPNASEKCINCDKS